MQIAKVFELLIETDTCYKKYDPKRVSIINQQTN